MGRIDVGTFYQFGEKDFRSIYAGITQETSTMLVPKMGDLEESYRSGKAAIITDEENVVGYVRFSPLLDDNLANKLGLPDSFPNISEIGTGIIDPAHRGRGLYKLLRGSLLESHADQIIDGRLLVIGTTKTMAILNTLHHATDLGMHFEAFHHQEFPMIAPFTCVCEGDFGQGYQHGVNACTKRVRSELIPLQQNLHMLEPHDGKIECCMYVSSRDGAQSINDGLFAFFRNDETHPLSNLVQTLRHPDINYYNERHA